MVEAAREVALARGLIDETGTRHRRALLRPLNGWQEWSLAATSGRMEPASAHHLLASCLDRIGDYDAVDATMTASLSRGDRARLALELRSLLFDDRLPLTQRCPNPDCRELADLDLSVAQLLGEVAGPEPEWFPAETDEGTALVRPPTGLDEELSLAGAGSADEQAAVLWSRIVGAVGDRRGISAEDWQALLPATRQSIALALAEGEAAPDLSFVSRCPACAGWIELEIDPFDLLAREVRLGAGRLLAEVHCIAFHYGWTEDAILTLPRNRRWRYLELLRDQLEGRPLTEGWR
jgi:hypothetical protein